MAGLVISGLILVMAMPGGHAAVNDRFKYYGGGATGNAIRLLAPYNSTTWPTKARALIGQSGAQSTTGAYSVNFTGSLPANNNDYVQRAWERSSDSPDLLSDAAIANRGRIEWILKNSYPRLNEGQLRDQIRAIDPALGFPAGYFAQSEAIAGTQAAIWYLTDGVELDLNSTNNSDRVKKLYTYLLTHSEDQEPSTDAQPELALISDTGRLSFAVQPQGLFGPFTVTSTTPVTLSVGGPEANAVSLVRADGEPLSGAQPSGTQFWLKLTSTQALPGSVTITAAGQPVTTTVVNAAFGTHNASPFTARQTLAQLSTSTVTAAPQALSVEWSIDNNDPGDFDPTGAATLRNFVYYERGEQSHTLQDIVFTDGTSTVTDLIGLTGQGADSANVYSADFAGTGSPRSAFGPRVPNLAGYEETDWSEGTATADNASAAEVTWILKNSYPAFTVSRLTSDLNAAGHWSGTGNIKNWEAIAATQAAIWHFTDGKDLDVTRYADPYQAVDGFGRDALGVSRHEGWAAPDTGPSVIDFTFPEKLELRSYELTRSSSSPESTPLGWRLQASSDGENYHSVSTTSVSSGDSRYFPDGGDTTRLNLGGGATYGGYRYYRLLLDEPADPDTAIQIQGITFNGFGVFGSQPTLVYRAHANPTAIVEAYNYLVKGAQQAAPDLRIEQTPQTLSISGPTEVLRETSDELIGPFSVIADTAVHLTLDGAAPDAGLIAEEDGSLVEDLTLASGDSFWVYPGDTGAADFVITATGSAKNWISARALNGQRQGVAAPQLTILGVESHTATGVQEVSVQQRPDAAVALDKNSVVAGQTVLVTGSDFRPGETVEVQLRSDIVVLGSVQADENGSFSRSFTTPVETLGAHHVVAIGLDSYREASAGLVLTQASSSEPDDTVDDQGNNAPINEQETISEDDTTEPDGDQAVRVDSSDSEATSVPQPTQVALTGPQANVIALLVVCLLLAGGIALTATSRMWRIGAQL